MAIDPAAISASPPVMTMAVEWAIPESPAARAKGTVSPSDIPITISLIVSEPVKCFSTCGVCGILLSRLNYATVSQSAVLPIQPPRRHRMSLMAAELTEVAHRGDDIVPTQYALDFIAYHYGQLADAIAIHLSKSVSQFSIR